MAGCSKTGRELPNELIYCTRIIQGPARSAIDFDADRFGYDDIDRIFGGGLGRDCLYFIGSRFGLCDCLRVICLGCVQGDLYLLLLSLECQP